MIGAPIATAVERADHFIHTAATTAVLQQAQLRQAVLQQAQLRQAALQQAQLLYLVAEVERGVPGIWYFARMTYVYIQGRGARKGDLSHADYCSFVSF